MQGPSHVGGDYFDVETSFICGYWRISKIAVLDNVDRKENNSFFQLTAKNRGLNYNFFYHDEREAITWLIDSENG